MEFIMQLGTGLFFILFAFLMAVFAVVVLSLFRKDASHGAFEPKVSIIIPAYNEEQHIGDCISSVRSLAYPEEKTEIIVVDDGSADHTASIARRHGAKVVTIRHAGKVAALNAGMKRARHGFLFTVDADTVVEQDCLRNLVSPFIQEDVGATTGNSRVKNSRSVIGAFQNIEYHYNNLIRASFSRVFRTGIWFFGALACYRKSALLKAGGFKKDTLAEDMDIALELKRAGYRSVNVPRAIGHTVAPSTVSSLYRQRFRWWMGTLQSLFKNKSLFSRKSPWSIHFLFINQYWWSVYAFLSLPLIIYQLNYWLPSNSHTIGELSGYLFRWFSLSGPVYVLYKIPEWGINYWTIFGVLSGIISSVMIVIAVRMFKDTFTLRNAIAVFFYFPYTILLNIIIAFSIIRYHLSPQRYFVR
ncbi:TPA: glycosyltransferase family 2 protein [Candidatus Woesearchaeota archaeon]|nr:glycosyltransferase family 2 protein [Candidatus Woesearchaeota archaeon]